MEQTKMNQINLPEGIQELIIREGRAAPIVKPEGIKVNGQIGTCVEFHKKRKPEPSTTHVTVDRKNAKITLIANDDVLDKERKVIITDSIAVHKDIAYLKIEGAAWSGTFDLAEALRRRRKWFLSEEQSHEVISALKSFKAKVDKKLESIDGKQTGKYKAAIEQVYTSNLPKVFRLKMPVIDGSTDLVEFEVELYLEIRDNGHNILLESPELEQILQDAIDDKIDEQIKILSKQYAVFEI